MVSMVQVQTMTTGQAAGESSMKARIRFVRRGLTRRHVRALRGVAHTRGVTLIEVMIVVVILGLIAGGVAVAVFPKYNEAQVKTTTTSAMELRRATEMWRGSHASDQCPTLEQLKQDKAVDSASKLTDAWNSPFKITCQDDETTVISYGHDKKEGTPDDIIVPAQGDQSGDQK